MTLPEISILIMSYDGDYTGDRFGCGPVADPEICGWAFKLQKTDQNIDLSSEKFVFGQG
jgi:hypothetical protein